MPTYRTQDTPSGLFNRLGTSHAHIDGAPFDATKAIIEQLGEQGVRGKVDTVLECIGGPQRHGLPEVYESHTAGEDGEEDFGCFSTVLLDDKSEDANNTIAFLQSKVTFPGAVIEVEEACASIDIEGRWHEEDPTSRIVKVDPSTLHFYAPPSHANIEVHHAVDISADEAGDIDLSAMMEAIGEELELGGLFRFEKGGGVVAVRSNSFTSPEGLRAHVEKQNRIFRSYMSDVLRVRKLSVRTLAERVVGVWHVDD